MTQRTKTLIIIFGGTILIVVAGVVVWLLTQQAEEPLTNTTPINKNVNVVVINTVPTNTNQSTNAQMDETVEARRLANLFVERFGSYSSEAEFQNIVDLKKFMTQKMQDWADTYVATQKKSATNAVSFQGLTAKVLTTSIINQSASGITFRITTWRTTDDGTVNGQKSYNQDILTRVVKEGEEWKVDSAYWQ